MPSKLHFVRRTCDNQHLEASTNVIVSRDFVCYRREAIPMPRCSSFNPSLATTSNSQHLLIPLPSIPNSILCPVSAIQHYFCMVPASPTVPFFCVPATSGCCLLTSSYLRSILKRLTSRIGLDPTGYSPHSFRRAGATFAFQPGVPDHLIKLHGDWRSNAYQAYLTLPLATWSRIADIIATSLSPAIIWGPASCTTP